MLCKIFRQNFAKAGGIFLIQKQGNYSAVSFCYELPRYMRPILIAVTILFLANCSMDWEKGQGSKIEVHQISLYDISENKIAKIYPAVKHKSVIYKDSYLGNFTYYYTPTIVNEDTVLVPQVHCYAAELDFPEEDYELYKNHSRCEYSETKRLYEKKPRNIFTIESGINIKIAKNIAIAWYDHMYDHLYIESIAKENGDYFIYQSGGACSGRYSVEVKSNGEILIEEPEIQICS